MPAKDVDVPVVARAGCPLENRSFLGGIKIRTTHLPACQPMSPIVVVFIGDVHEVGAPGIGIIACDPSDVGFAVLFGTRHVGVLLADQRAPPRYRFKMPKQCHRFRGGPRVDQ